MSLGDPTRETGECLLLGTKLTDCYIVKNVCHVLLPKALWPACSWDLHPSLWTPSGPRAEAGPGHLPPHNPVCLLACVNNRSSTAVFGLPLTVCLPPGAAFAPREVAVSPPLSAVSPGPGILQVLNVHLTNEWKSGEAESGKEWAVEIQVNIQIHSCY